ncbi:hypothetical protein OUZ56_005085 [Daphnia magna]|uniref:Uncharacterized protein n=1 Tax=Daphnia magna TaxID=35525 RepID=A0ABQ9YRS6_9CRUS|nr:hypothetical protein OUZ56_005085 [Daphnia magna]
MKEDRNWFKPWVVRADQQQTPPCNTSLPPSRAQKSEQLNYYQQEPLDYATRRHGSASKKDCNLPLSSGESCSAKTDEFTKQSAHRLGWK